MKRIYILLILLLISRVVYAQEIKKSFNRGSFGVTGNQQLRDIGTGINFTSSFWGQKRKSAVRLAYNFRYLEHLDANSKVVWTNYMNIKLGYVLSTNPVNDFFRFYLELGGIILFPNRVFSEKSTEFGFYDLIGFEFFFTGGKNPYKSMFFEMGAVISGAKAERVITEPPYSNGFSISVGVRIFFKSREN